MRIEDLGPGAGEYIDVRVGACGILFVLLQLTAKSEAGSLKRKGVGKRFGKFEKKIGRKEPYIY